MIRGACLLSAIALSACATEPSFSGYVTPLSPDAGIHIANDITAFVAERVPSGTAQISVQEPQDDTIVGPVLIGELQSAGYQVTSHQAKHALRYEVATISEGTFLRIALDHWDAARLYGLAPDGKSLIATGPFSVRKDD